MEAGQADLFLSGFLGIDFQTRGRAVYRLLDAEVCFHRGLPGAGEVIRYDIRIDDFFRQGDTWLFRFGFEATVDGAPLLTMSDGCAGFFTSEELAAGKGIVRTALDLQPDAGQAPGGLGRLRAGRRRELFRARSSTPCARATWPAASATRSPDCRCANPVTLPGGRMKLVHRIAHLDPAGGRFGLGIVAAKPTSTRTTGSSPAISSTTASCPAR